jgi:hypothetical protein
MMSSSRPEGPAPAAMAPRARSAQRPAGPRLATSGGGDGGVWGAGRIGEAVPFVYARGGGACGRLCGAGLGHFAGLRPRPAPPPSCPRPRTVVRHNRDCRPVQFRPQPTTATPPDRPKPPAPGTRPPQPRPTRQEDLPCDAPSSRRPRPRAGRRRRRSCGGSRRCARRAAPRPRRARAAPAPRRARAAPAPRRAPGPPRATPVPLQTPESPTALPAHPTPTGAQAAALPWAACSGTAAGGAGAPPNRHAWPPLQQHGGGGGAPAAWQQQARRGMFIQTQPTPNPLSLMFVPGRPIMEVRGPWGRGGGRRAAWPAARGSAAGLPTRPRLAAPAASA